MPASHEHDLPPLEHVQLGTVFAALADPVRRLIVRELVSEPVGARRQCSSFGVEVAKSTMTHHFRMLREAGLIIQYNHGNRAELELRRADLEERFPGLLSLVASSSDQAAASPSDAETTKPPVKRSPSRLQMR